MNNSENTISPELKALASAAGILTDFWDVKGRRIDADRETLCALLETLGYPDPAGREDVLLQSAEDRRWQRMLPPVVLFREGDSEIQFDISVAAGRSNTLDCLKIVECPGVPGSERGKGLQRIELAGLLDTPLAERIIGEETWQRYKVGQRCALPFGYYYLQLFSNGRILSEAFLIASPNRCFALPEDGSRFWGLSSQIYSLRSSANNAVGGFAEVGSLTEKSAELGADVLGLSPLHASGGGRLQYESPYFSSSRAAYNFLFVDSTHWRKEWDLAEEREPEEILALNGGEQQSGEVDYQKAHRLKLEDLQALHASVLSEGTRSLRIAKSDFARFVESCSGSAREYAEFHALESYYAELGVTGGWRSWPASEEVEASTIEGKRNFYLFCQWLAELDLERLQRNASNRGMQIGLYLDFALGARDDGAEVWANSELYADGVTMGAPPDTLAPQGQDWGLPPFHPERLREAGFAPFIAALRANMRFAGAIRIDHVMSLFRLFWRVGSTGSGAYVRYPVEEMMAIIAVESARHSCIVIGEDLGTVPPEVSEAMERFGVLSYKVLLFMRAEDEGFVAPDRYPESSLAVASTHDLPTLSGYRNADDLSLREELGLFDADVVREWTAERGEDLKRLYATLTAWTEPDSIGSDRELVESAHLFLAEAGSRIAIFQLEDLLLERRQVNLPGTSSERKNWSLRMRRSLEEVFSEAKLREHLGEIALKRRS